MAGKKQKNQKKRSNVSNGKKMAKIKGSGSYQLAANLAAGAVANSIKSMLNKHIPSGTFEKAGSRLGAKLGRGLAGITGVGDYVLNDTFVNNNNNAKNGLTPQVVSNCEYAFELTADGTPGFDVFRQLINPTNTSLFPWLSRIARLYTKYRFTQLVFEYRSTSSDYASGGGLGSVIFAPQYNVNLEAFPTKQVMQAATHAVSTKPSNGMLCGLECSPKDQNFKWMYVRAPGEEATPMTDMGWFNWALYGCPASNGVGIGEVWVHYTCELIEPVIARTLPSNVTRCCLQHEQTTAGLMKKAWGFPSLSASTVSNRTYNLYNPGADMKVVWGSVIPSTPYDVLFMTSGDADRIYFNRPGLYIINASAYLTTAYTAGMTTTMTSGSGAVLSGEQWEFPASTTTDRKVYTYHRLVQITNPNDYIAVRVDGTGDTSSVIYYANLEITCLNPSF